MRLKQVKSVGQRDTVSDLELKPQCLIAIRFSFHFTLVGYDACFLLPSREFPKSILNSLIIFSLIPVFYQFPCYDVAPSAGGLGAKILDQCLILRSSPSQPHLGFNFYGDFFFFNCYKAYNLRKLTSSVFLLKDIFKTGESK